MHDVSFPDMYLWAEVFGPTYSYSAAYHIARTQIKAERGYPEAKRKWTKFQTAKAAARLMGQRHWLD